ncbi:hypothetical protein F5Y16DRAFT_424030 [Xylariaceae sp. FL0255]|nr:hypothetical protein F5Y16DRAFT_424030 [Xylariaceae sp. FL0255]
MDTSHYQKEIRERPSRRAPSRASSTGTAHTQATTKSASSSSSQPRVAGSTNPPHSHRYHHAHCSERGTALARSSSNLSRESNEELKRITTPVSTLLHEKLQRERQAESDRQASRLATDLSSSTGDIQDQFSPSRTQPGGIDRRPRSSHDEGSSSSKSTMGAKQTEKAVSTLHKQNFDLKLELFHRREKQTSLEAQIDKLEAEQTNLEAERDHLTRELDKRDKAIEEAVNMIVQLEARVDELVREREMAQRVEAEGAYRPSFSHVTDSSAPAERTNVDDDASPWLDPKTLARMPSFLSERSAQTENLRNVVLQSRGTLLHTRKVSEVSSSSADVSEVNRVASPSLSMLSESSFISIYGSKDSNDTLRTQAQDDALGMDGAFDDRSPTPTKKTTRYLQTNHPNMPLGAGSSAAVPIRTDQTKAVDRTLQLDSPLQKLEKLGEPMRNADTSSRPSTSGRARSVATPVSFQSARSPHQSKGPQARKNPLQRVVTNYSPTQKELANSHALPPTPDTVSSSVLRKQKHLSSSQDSLPTPTNGQASMLRSDSSDRVDSWRAQERHGLNMNAHMASTSAFTSRHGLPTPEMDGDLFAGISQLTRLVRPRPRSAAETTISRPRTASIILDSDSDSDSDGGADAHHDADKGDYWMRESYKPNRRKSGAPVSRRPPSPDLFSFPVDAGGWEPDAMFGALKGHGFLGSPVPGLKRDPIDEMATSLQSPTRPDPLEAVEGRPEPPVRRSSLQPHDVEHAQLASGKVVKTSPAKDRTPRKMNVKGRSNSVDLTGRALPSRSQVEAASTTTKKNHYPPISGLQSRGRGLPGLNMLFRRSGSESHNTTPLSATERESPLSTTTPTMAGSYQTPQYQQMQLRSLIGPAAGRSSVPPPASLPWTAARPIRAFEDDYQSATPPPILRNRPPPASVQVVDPAVPETASAGGNTVQVEADTPAAPSGPSTPNKTRKWLGLGRMGSLKNRV